MTQSDTFDSERWTLAPGVYVLTIELEAASLRDGPATLHRVGVYFECSTDEHGAQVLELVDKLNEQAGALMAAINPQPKGED